MAINLYSKASVDSLLSPKLSISSLSNAAATTLNATAPTTDQVLSFDGTELKWATVSGGGGLTISTLSNGATSTINATAPTTGQALTYDGTDLVWATVGGSGPWLGDRISIYAGYLYNEDSSTYVSSLKLHPSSVTTIEAQNLTLQATGGGVLTFSDATTQSTAAIGIPAGGATGAVLTKDSGTDYDVSWVAPSGCNVQTFGSSSTAGSFTWTKPTGAKWVEFFLFAGGGGGGSGARQSTGTLRAGGGAGAGGTTCKGRVNAAYLGSTETVEVGAGGAGGAAVTANSTNGNPGSAGTDSRFYLFKAVGGNFGAAGTTTSPSAAGASRSSLYDGAIASQGVGGDGRSASGLAGSNITNALSGSGGGGGAGALAGGTTAANGGAGGSFATLTTSASLISTIAGGSAGTSAGVAATAGTSMTTQYAMAGTGGGGGYYITATAGGTGGAGGWPSGGGGGGGASDNSFASGAGGAGANGFVVIITYF